MFYFFRRFIYIMIAVSFLGVASGTSVDAAQTGSRYTNKARKFSVDIPKGWERAGGSDASDEGDIELVFDEKNAPAEITPGRFILDVRNAQGASLQEFVLQQKDDATQTLQEMNTDARTLKERSLCIAGVDAYILEYVVVTDEKRGQVAMAFLAQNDRFYSLALMGDDRHWKKRYAPLFEKIITSFSFTTKTRSCKVKPAIHKGSGFQLRLPQRWVAGDAAALKEINNAFTSLGFPLRAHALLSHPKYGERAYIIVASDPETKDKKGKVLNAKGYAVESLRQSGVKPNTKAMKALKMAGLPAVQWSMIDPQTKKESVMTTVITKAGIAYSLFLEAEGGLYQKDKALRSAYSTLQKTFKFTKKAKSKKVKSKK